MMSGFDRNKYRSENMNNPTSRHMMDKPYNKDVIQELKPLE